MIPQSIWHQLKSSLIGSTVAEKMLGIFIEQDIQRMCEVAECYAFCVEDYYIQQGYQETRRPLEEVRHVKWAVVAQLEKSYSEIAEDARLFDSKRDRSNSSNVRSEVLKIFSAIGLSPRSRLSQKGRPPGRKTKYSNPAVREPRKKRQH